MSMFMLEACSLGSYYSINVKLNTSTFRLKIKLAYIFCCLHITCVFENSLFSIDVDECERPWTQCDNVTSSCRNTIGDYQCDCLQGYEQGDSVYECVGEWL